MTASEARDQLSAIVRTELAEACERGRRAGRSGADAYSPPALESLAALRDIMAAADTYASASADEERTVL